MNKIAKDLFDKDADFKDFVTTLAHKQMARRPVDYAAKAIFEPEDLEQEIWCALFECECADKQSLEIKAEDYAEYIARKSRKKRCNTVEVPISQLCDKQRGALANLFYSSDYGEVDETQLNRNQIESVNGLK